jgi:16S rRNA (cytidine1402-2'-O)-methyltransferase
MAGILYVVATPIGNLEDLTFRALRTLKEVDLIAAEDTRHTLKLLSHYGVSKPLVSLREHNEAREGARLIVRLKANQNIALVSDAGTPAIADPGARLVRTVRAEGIRVVPIPGPSAVTAAISVSGLDSTEFTFKGFPPPARIARRQWLETLKATASPIVFLEAPHRILETIADSEEILVKRQIMVFRELTKINETLVIRPILEPCDDGRLVERGEFTVVVGQAHTSGTAHPVNQIAVDGLFNLISESGLVQEKNIATAVAAAFDIDVPSALKAAKKGRILAKRQSELAP